MKGNPLQSFVTGRHGSYLTQFYRPRTKFYPTRAAMRQAVSLKSIERRLVLPLDALQWPRALEVLSAGYARLARTPEHYQRVIRVMVSSVTADKVQSRNGTSALDSSLPSSTTPSDKVLHHTSGAARDVTSALDRLRDQAYAGEIPSNSSLFVTLIWAYCSLGQPEEAAETLQQCQRRNGFSRLSLHHVLDLVVPLLCQHGKAEQARCILREAGEPESRFHRELAEAEALGGNWNAAVRRLGIAPDGKPFRASGGNGRVRDEGGDGLEFPTHALVSPASALSDQNEGSSYATEQLSTLRERDARNPVSHRTTRTYDNVEATAATTAGSSSVSKRFPLTPSLFTMPPCVDPKEWACRVERNAKPSPLHKEPNEKVSHTPPDASRRNAIISAAGVNDASGRGPSEIASLSTPALRKLLLACLKAAGGESSIGVSGTAIDTSVEGAAAFSLTPALWRELFENRRAVITEELFYALLNCIGHQHQSGSPLQDDSQRSSKKRMSCAENDAWMEAVRWFVWMFLPDSNPSKYLPTSDSTDCHPNDLTPPLFYRPPPEQFPSLSLTAVALNLVFGVYPIRVGRNAAAAPNARKDDVSNVLQVQHPVCMRNLLDDLLWHREDAQLTNYMLSRVVPALLQEGQFERGFQLLKQATLLSPSSCEAAASPSSTMPTSERRLQRDLMSLVYTIHAHWQRPRQKVSPSSSSTAPSLSLSHYTAVRQLPHLFPPEVRAAAVRGDGAAAAMEHLFYPHAPSGFGDLVEQAAGTGSEDEKEQEDLPLSDAERISRLEEEQRFPTSLRRCWQHYFSQQSTAQLTEAHDAALKRDAIALARQSRFASFEGNADRDPRPAPRGLHDKASGWTYFGRGGEMVFPNSRRTPHPFSMHPKVMRSRADPYRGWSPRENSIHAHKENVVKWNGKSSV